MSIFARGRRLAQRLPIGVRLGAGFAAPLLAMAGLGVAASADVTATAAATRALHAHPYAVTRDLQEFRGDVLLGNDMLNQALRAPGTADAAGFQALRQASEASLAKAGAAYLGAASDFKNLREAAGEFWDGADGAMKAIVDGKPDIAGALIDGEGRAHFVAVLRVGGRMLNVAEHDATSFVAAAAARSTATRRQMLLLTVAVLLAGIGLTALIGRSVTVPLGQLRNAMLHLAEGNLDQEVPATGRGDEMGAMAQAVLVFRDKGREAKRLAAEQAAAQEARAARAERLGRLVAGFEVEAGQSVGQVAAAATELQATAQAMTGIAGRTNGQTATVAAASEEASVSIATVATAADELAMSIDEIARRVGESADIAGRAQRDAERTDAIVRALAESSQRIGDVLGLISTIAGQTNLLALNATIEAARAGDAGKGFAVVASEVKNLASQTAKATGDIGEQIAHVQSATREAVAAIEGISATVGEINAIAAAISAAVEEQGASTREIARNVQQVAGGAQQVSATIVDVTAGANETGTAATQVLGAAEQLSRHAERLQSEVGRFIAEVQAA